MLEIRKKMLGNPERNIYRRPWEMLEIRRKFYIKCGEIQRGIFIENHGVVAMQRKVQ